MNAVCGSCIKNERDQRRNSYFINDTDTSAPQSILDI